MTDIHKPTTAEVLPLPTLMWQGVIVGLCAGAVVAVFRLSHLHAANWIAKTLHDGGVGIGILWFAILFALAFGIRRLTRLEPLIAGSGIPQTELALAGKIHLCWWRILLCKFSGAWLSLAAGLSIGREGPCVQMGGVVGVGLGRFWKQTSLVSSPYLMGGAVAGLSAAFGAPVAGVLFAFEEMKCHRTLPLIVFACCAAAGSAIMMRYGFGIGLMLPMQASVAFPFATSLAGFVNLFLFGLLLGGAGAAYNLLLLRMRDAEAAQKRIPDAWRMVPVFLCAGIIAYVFPGILGGGENLILSFGQGALVTYGVWTLLGFLLCKSLFSMYSVTATVPGGLLMPILCLGALLGGVWAQSTTFLAPVSEPSTGVWYLLWGMAGFFAATVRAPLTGIALVLEMTGMFAGLPGCLLVAFVAATTAKLLRSSPVYDSLKERIPLPALSGETH